MSGLEVVVPRGLVTVHVALTPAYLKAKCEQAVLYCIARCTVNQSAIQRTLLVPRRLLDIYSMFVICG